MLSLVLPTAALASTAMAASLQVRQETVTSDQVSSHALQSVADLAAPGYAGIIWPVNRGYNKATHREFCGGLPVSENRNTFPLTGGRISTLQQKDVSNFQLTYSTEQNPTTLDSFKPLASNYTLLNFGFACTEAPDFAAAGLAAGQNLTIALEYTYGTHQFQYRQCSDITLVDVADFTGDPYKQSQICIDAQIPQSLAVAMTNGSSNAVFSAASHGDSGLSAAAGGGIGASVTLVVLGAILAALAAMGLLSFGRKTQAKASGYHPQAHSRDNASNDSGSAFAEKAV